MSKTASAPYLVSAPTYEVLVGFVRFDEIDDHLTAVGAVRPSVSVVRFSPSRVLSLAL